MRDVEVRALAAAALANEPAGLVALLRFRARALFDRDQAVAAEDARAVSRLAAAAHPETFETRVSPGPVSGTFSVRIASPWRPRFLEEIAGCCTLTGLDILDARLVADTGELTLASVIVRSYARTPILADTWTRLDRLLGRAYAGELDLPSRLTSALPAARPTSDLSLDWNLDDPVASVLHVVAEDRPGLLFSLAKAVHDAGLVVVSARAVVRESIAVDTLRLVGEDGAPIKTPGRLGHLSMRIRASLESR
jgi:[protein-PII] uridylyltransferase